MPLVEDVGTTQRGPLSPRPPVHSQTASRRRGEAETVLRWSRE